MTGRAVGCIASLHSRSTFGRGSIVVTTDADTCIILTGSGRHGLSTGEAQASVDQSAKRSLFPRQRDRSGPVTLEGEATESGPPPFPERG